MADSVTSSIYEWARGYDPNLRLNAVLERDGDSCLQTGLSNIVEEYIDGSFQYRTDFSLVMMAPWSEGIDGLNEDAMATGEEWCEWVNSQFPDNVPALGYIDELRSEETPFLAQVLPDGMRAKYMFTCYVVWRKL